MIEEEQAELIDGLLDHGGASVVDEFGPGGDALRPLICWRKRRLGVACVSSIM